MIRYLPPPYSPKELKGAGFLSTLGRYSRPVVKKFLRLGKNIAINQLSKTAAAAIKDGGNLLSKLAPLKKGGKKRSYKQSSSSQAFIHRPASLANRRVKKFRSQKQSSNIRGGKIGEKKKRKREKKGKKKASRGGKKGGKKKASRGGKKGGKKKGGKKKASRGGKKGGQKKVRRGGKKKTQRRRKRFSVFDSL